MRQASRQSAVKVALDLRVGRDSRRRDEYKDGSLAGLGRLGVRRLEVLRDEAHQLFDGLETHGLARIHVLDTSAEDAPIEIGFRPDLDDEVALHLAFRIS